MCQIFDMRQVTDPPTARSREAVPASGATILLFTGCWRERYESLPTKWAKPATVESRAPASPRERLGATVSRGKRGGESDGAGSGRGKKEGRKAPARGGKRA